MEPKLFVGNLPSIITEESIYQVFALYGIIERIVLIEKVGTSGARSCFVVYKDHSSCQQAISALHANFSFPGGSDRVVVRYADSAKGERGGGVRSAHHDNSDHGQCHSATEAKLFVGNLPATITEEAISQLFGLYGPLERVILMEKPSPSGARSAFVIFADHSSSSHAISALHANYIFSGGTDAIVVRYADSTKGDRAAHSGPAGHPSDVKLFVGNLPQEATQDSLTELMSEYGQVTHVHMMTNPTSTGAVCAFVEYATNAQCHAAINALNGMHCFPPRESPMTVTFARRQGGPSSKQPAYPSLASSSSPSDSSSSVMPQEVKLFVGNLPLQMTQDALREMFQPFGNLLEAFLFKRGTETAKGAFVRFSDRHSAENAMRVCNNMEIAGQRIVVQLARSHKGEQSHEYNNDLTGMPAGLDRLAQLQLSPLSSVPGFSQSAPMPQYLGAARSISDSLAQYYAAYGGLAMQTLQTMSQPALVQLGQLGAVGSLASLNPLASMVPTVSMPQATKDVATIQLENLPPHYTESNVATMFAMFGNVVGCTVTPEMDGRTARGTVTFSNKDNANFALQVMNDFHIGSYRLKCALKPVGSQPD